MRDKVLKAIEIYAEGGTIKKARAEAGGVTASSFYKIVYDDPELEDLYIRVQKARADMLVDESMHTSMDDEIDPKRARVQTDIKLKIAGFFNRQRFGPTMDITVEERVSVSAALKEAKARSLRPPRDLSQVQDAQIVDLPALTDQRPTDKQSDVQVAAPQTPRINPFD